MTTKFLLKKINETVRELKICGQFEVFLAPYVNSNAKFHQENI